MKVLLDEDVPRYLKRELAEHDVSTVRENGWSGIGNGVVLALATAAGFEALVTCDRNIEHQQHIPTLELAIVVLAVPRKQRDTVLPLAPDILALLATHPQPGTVTVVGTWRVREP